MVWWNAVSNTATIGVLGMMALAGVDAHKVRGVVQRRKIRKALDGLDQFIGDERGLCELLAAMNNAVANCIDLIHALHNADFGIGQRVEHHAGSHRYGLSCPA